MSKLRSASIVPSRPGRRLLTVFVTTIALSGCGSLDVNPFAAGELKERSAADRIVARADVEPLTGPLTLEEAIARALKYNLDNRGRMMEEAIALNQLEAGKYDMLPKLTASAGYREADEYRITNSMDSVTGQPSLAHPFISSAKEHTTTGLGLTWNLMDFGLSYFNAKQQADRVMVASERRRKAMHTLIQDVRSAFWRTASAQKLRGEIKATLTQAEEALNDSRRVEAAGLRSPLDSLRYQRQLLENLRMLETIDQDLSVARVELANLINVPVILQFTVVEPAELLDARILELPVERMEELAIAQNADLREQFYNARIASQETRKTLIKLFPGLRFSYDKLYDSDVFLINKHWNEIGAQLSFNLMNLLSGPTQYRLAEAGIALADQKRVATQMTLLAQVHIARQQYANTRRIYERSQNLWEVDDRIARHVRNQERAETQSRNERVASSTAAIVSLLRRYQALAQAHAAAGRLQATLGLEPKVGSVSETSLADLTAAVAASLKQWHLPLEQQAPVSAAELQPVASAKVEESSLPAEAASAPNAVASRAPVLDEGVAKAVTSENSTPAEAPAVATETNTTIPVTAAPVAEVPATTPPNADSSPAASVISGKELLQAIQSVQQAHPEYGSRRVALALRRQGLVVDRDEVRRLMTELRLSGAKAL